MAVVVPILLTWGLSIANRYTGISLDEAAKNNISEAIISGILAAILHATIGAVILLVLIKVIKRA